MHVRRAEPSDVATMVDFIHELAEFEREPDAVQISVAQLHDALFGSAPHLFAHVCETEDAVVGMAIWFLNFSTWEGTHGIYVEDLYVTPAMRGRGAGRALLAALAARCVERGYARLELSVLDWNQKAIDFYRSVGATGMEDWTVQRITGRALAELSRSPM